MGTFTRFEAKAFSRKKGHSAVRASAYRTGQELYCEQTNKVYNFEFKKDVLYFETDKNFRDSEHLWNSAEKAEKRKDATIQREFLCSFDKKISVNEAKKLARNFCKKIQKKHLVAYEFAIHKGKDGDNPHLHIILSTRRFENGKFTEKSRELDDRKSGLIDFWRKEWQKDSDTILKLQIRKKSNLNNTLYPRPRLSI